MSSARRLYRLHLGLAGLGTVSVALALFGGLSGFGFANPSFAQLQAACHGWLPQVGMSELLLLGITGLGTAVAWRAVASLVQQITAQSRLRQLLGATQSVELSGNRVKVIDQPRPQAFCTGYLRPTVVLSSGAVASLSGSELRAVLAHECHHQLRRDPLRMCLGVALGEAFFFLPAVGRSAERYAKLSEVAADEAAIAAAGHRPLASALLRFGDRASDMGRVVGIAPERVDHLMGTPARWRLSAVTLVGSVLGLGALTLAAVGTVTFLQGARLSLPLVLAQSCMPLMVAGAILLLASGLHLIRPARSRQLA